MTTRSLIVSPAAGPRSVRTADGEGPPPDCPLLRALEGAEHGTR